MKITKIADSIMVAALLKKADWFNMLSPDAQKEYIKDHPNSARAKGVSGDDPSLKKLPKTKLPDTKDLLKIKPDLNKLNDKEKDIYNNYSKTLKMVSLNHTDFEIEQEPTMREVKEVVHLLQQKGK